VTSFQSIGYIRNYSRELMKDTILILDK